MRVGTDFKSVPSLILAIALAACDRAAESPETALPKVADLERQCREEVGPARVEEVADGVFVAIGYDLANTILVRTRDGNVVVDVSTSPARARVVKAALLARAPGPIRAIVYTHSHVDHVGGASEWIEGGTEIWATDAFRDHLVKQYGLFRKTESLRGARQFGRHTSAEELPCIAIGARLDFEAIGEVGMRFPTRTFVDTTSFEIGGRRFELVEAHGETHDQLFVWIPDVETLLAGDNFYSAFPNLYTIRGTSPRPVDEWIRSLDEMRRRAPEVLVPSHTRPRRGREEIARVLRDYRDGIQWVRDAVVRGANRGETVDAILAKLALPQHLLAVPELRELYGQVDWSARAIYTNELGWFDGRPEALYPPRAGEIARREIELMGGAERVLEEAQKALDGRETRFAIHLLTKLADATAATDESRALLAKALRALAAVVANSNGRGYLLESAREVEHGIEDLPAVKVDETFAAGIPLATFFRILATRLHAEEAVDVEESVEFRFRDGRERFHVTVRRGVAEVIAGDPLPGTPEPIARVDVDAMTWRRLALDMQNPVAAVASGGLRVDGSWFGFLRFMARFERGV